MNFPEKQNLVKRIQKVLGLSQDGVDGPNTWNAIVSKLIPRSIQPTKPNNNSSSSKLAEKMVSLAKKEIGVEEVNGTNCGPRVNEYKSATWLDSTKSWPWCAAFICWLFRESMKDGKYSFERPQTAGAWDFENWAKKQDSSVLLKKPHYADIKSGDIVIFTFSHIGIATSSPDSNGMVSTIEGNTDGAGSREGGSVLAKKRKISQIRSVIRVSV
jgi:hypothetical protein